MTKEKKLKYDRAHLHFSKEQKIKIVQEIESGQLTRKEAMEKYNVVGNATLNSWLRQYCDNPEGVVRKKYEKADQRLAAYKILTGESTVDEIARVMQIGSNTVSGWVRKYRKDVQQKPPSTPKKTSQEQVTSLDKDQQKELAELRLKVAGLEMMIDIAEKDLKIDIRKKSGTKQ
jgi:transposase